MKLRLIGGLAGTGAVEEFCTPDLYTRIVAVNAAGPSKDGKHTFLYAFIFYRKGEGTSWVMYFNNVEQFLSAATLLRKAGVVLEDKSSDQILTRPNSDNNIYQGGKRMLNQVTTDVKEFVQKNREVIYVIVGIALLDQILFKGAFRTRLESLVSGLLKKAEDKINPKVD